MHSCTLYLEPSSFFLSLVRRDIRQVKFSFILENIFARLFFGVPLLRMFSQCLYCLHLFQHIDSYSATKAEGEALVIKSNGINGLLTCCIRPSGIFGPGDKLLVPSLVSAARAGKSKASMFIVLLSFEFASFSVSSCAYDIQILYSSWGSIIHIHSRIHE